MYGMHSEAATKLVKHPTLVDVVVALPYSNAMSVRSDQLFVYPGRVNIAIRRRLPVRIITCGAAECGVFGGVCVCACLDASGDRR